jgi:hypothetical protein
LTAPDGKELAISAVELVDVPEQTTYNLTVEETHTYFVGTGVLVHNDPIVYPFGTFKVYLGTNDLWPDLVYVGQTDDPITTRQGGHRSYARARLAEGGLSPRDQRFFEFMKDVTIREVVGGLTAEMADHIEQQNIEIEATNRGRGNVLNRREQITSADHLRRCRDAIVKQIREARRTGRMTDDALICGV